MIWYEYCTSVTITIVSNRHSYRRLYDYKLCQKTSNIEYGNSLSWILTSIPTQFLNLLGIGSCVSLESLLRIFFRIIYDNSGYFYQFQLLVMNTVIFAKILEHIPLFFLFYSEAHFFTSYQNSTPFKCSINHFK